MGLSIERVESLLLVAAVVAMLARRLRMPYTVGLVVAGDALAFSPISSPVQLTRRLMFSAFLPPLIFEAAIHIPGRELRSNLALVFTSVPAYGSFLLAEHFRLSGVLATLTARLLTGNLGPLGAISARGREAVESSWEYVAFVVNSLIFILIGMSEAPIDFSHVLRPATAAIIVVLLGRALSVYGRSALFLRSSQKVNRRHQHILFWGGLRGARALALALGLPSTVPHRAEVVSVAFAAVPFSIVVHGLTRTPLMRRLGTIPASPIQDRSEGMRADASSG